MRIIMVLTAMRITAVRTGDIGIGRMATGATIEGTLTRACSEQTAQAQESIPAPKVPG